MRLSPWLGLAVVLGGCAAPAPAPMCHEDGAFKRAKRAAVVPTGMPIVPLKIRPWGPPSPDRFQIDHDALLSALVLAEQGALPVTALPNGHYRVLGALPGSLLEQAGLRVNDEITAIAGKKLDDRDLLAEALRVWQRDGLLTVSVQRNGEAVELAYTREPPPSTARPNAGGAGMSSSAERHIELPRATVDDLLENQAGLMRSVRIIPHHRDGEVVGLRLSSIRPDSTFAALGLLDGDVLLRINGYDVSDADKALAAYSTIRKADEVRVDIERRGESLTLIYRLVP